VLGESNDPFGTGKYALSINFGYGPTPSVAPFQTAMLDGSQLQTASAQADTPGQETVDGFPDSAPPAPVTTPARSAAVIDVAAVLQAAAVAPPSATTLQVQSAVLVSPGVAAPLATAVTVAATLPAGGAVVQPAPIALGAMTTSPTGDDAPADRPGATPVPAPKAAPVQAEQATRALPAAAPASPEPVSRELPVAGSEWREASTAYFSAESDGAALAPLGEQPSGIALEAAAAVAGFVAVAGESRYNALRDALDEHQRRPRR
jgi:hypothetical protein